MFKLTIVIALSCFALMACAEATEEVRMGTEGAYPPYNFINESGEVDGLERELGDELCKRAEIDCVWVTNDWDTIITNLQAEDYDTIMAGMSITDERDELIDFTQPYIPPSPSVYFALASAGESAVSGKVAAQASTIQADYLSETGAMPLEYATAPELVEAILSGDADAALVDQGFALEYTSESEGMLVLVGPKVLLDDGVGIGVREEDSDLKDKLDSAISEMKADGSLNALIEEWLGPEAEKF